MKIVCLTHTESAKPEKFNTHGETIVANPRRDVRHAKIRMAYEPDGFGGASPG